MPRRPVAVVPVPAVAAVVALACSGSAAPQCRVGADCASGACDSSGRCVPPASQDAAGDDAGASDDADAAATDGGDDSANTGDGSTGCKPDGDGIVQRAEVPLVAGLHASFLVAENVSVSTAGATQSDGSRAWDFTGALSGDHTVVATTDATSGQWYSPQFATATYATRLSDTQDLIGVFQAASDGLRLQGIVSPSSGAQQTELTYAPAAEALALPMAMGTTWGATSQITGTAMGVPSAYSENWQSSVDAHGSLKVPYGTFAVLRVKTTLTRTVGVTITIIRSFAFVAECFGTVAAVTSQLDEPNDEFTSAAEIRRLTQ